MKLSIITVNRNNDKGLRNTLKSVLNQSFDDFEHLVIDGASTDTSVEYIKEFDGQTTYDFRWISEPDTGVYQAMNKGIKMAKGEYLLFLNSGDFLLGNNVLNDVFCLNNCTADIICARCNVSDKGTVVWTSNPPQQITFGTLYNQGLAHQSTFIKKKLFENLGLYREDFRYNSDIEFWYRAIILNNATTQSIKTIVSDYNLDGISSKENLTEAYKNEITTIFSHPILQRFVPDYESWKNEQQSMEILYWIKSKKIFYNLICVIFNNLKKLKGKKNEH